MTASLRDDLSALTGEELYHLICELSRAEVRTVEEIAACERYRLPVSGAPAMLLDIIDCKLDALAQIARVTIPVRDAAAIIYRARFARNHPVKVPGT